MRSSRMLLLSGLALPTTPVPNGCRRVAQGWRAAGEGRHNPIGTVLRATGPTRPKSWDLALNVALLVYR